MSLSLHVEQFNMRSSLMNNVRFWRTCISSSFHIKEGKKTQGCLDIGGFLVNKKIIREKRLM